MCLKKVIETSFVRVVAEVSYVNFLAHIGILHPVALPQVIELHLSMISANHFSDLSFTATPYFIHHRSKTGECQFLTQPNGSIQKHYIPLSNLKQYVEGR